LVATTLPTKAFLGTIFKDCFCWLEAKVAVPYIPAFRSLLALFVISLQEVQSFIRFAAIKVILPEKVLSGYTLATTLVVFLL
jgi:hypothetical protein